MRLIQDRVSRNHPAVFAEVAGRRESLAASLRIVVSCWHGCGYDRW